MKISFDLDGTVWKYPKQFSWLFHQYKANGYGVGILTAHYNHIEIKDIQLLKARCGFTPDFFINKNETTYPDANEPTGAWKARMVVENVIAIHYDDFDIHKPEYHPAYVESFSDYLEIHSDGGHWYVIVT